MRQLRDCNFRHCWLLNVSNKSLCLYLFSHEFITKNIFAERKIKKEEIRIRYFTTKGKQINCKEKPRHRQIVVINFLFLPFSSTEKETL